MDEHTLKRQYSQAIAAIRLACHIDSADEETIR